MTMNTSQRFEIAIQKLYTAFHNNTLNPECCKQCAVGNILDNTDAWKHLSDDHGSFQLNYVGKVHQQFGRKFNGYSPTELLHIETEFLKGCGYSLPLRQNKMRPENPHDKDLLFSGLSAVISYLCELDNVSNVMDYSKLLNYESKKVSKNKKLALI